MTTILKFAYIMITCLFLLHIAAQEVLQYELFDCNEDRDCDNVICVAGGIPKCITPFCFCF
ncbi:Nodule Cysteine-Rich (NCR) secreted peptide [Medicago truncatula]|uniref:Nodule Cysteine-Rich (NCR) secreted peptide n=1 Tax=Medicago truncatula TaxID=3880 RepID=A0A072U556_MEDTR|nr:Nodule Cysteine-Rich (NCR) secreted peptide [Medicago truncatula]